MTTQAKHTPRQLAEEIADAGALIEDERDGVIAAAKLIIAAERRRQKLTREMVAQLERLVIMFDPTHAKHGKLWTAWAESANGRSSDFFRGAELERARALLAKLDGAS